MAEANWAPALQHLLSQAPVTAEDKQLWLEVLPLVETLLGSHAAQPTGLHLLAVSLGQPALLVLGRGQGAQGPPSLPLALTNHSDATLMFSAAQEQLTSIAVTQVSCSMRVTLCQRKFKCVCACVCVCLWHRAFAVCTYNALNLAAVHMCRWLYVVQLCNGTGTLCPCSKVGTIVIAIKCSAAPAAVALDTQMLHSDLHTIFHLTVQVTLATLTSLLHEAQLLNQPATCADILHAIDAPALITVLCTAYIANAEAAYGSRTAALGLLTQLIACVRTAWDSHLGAVAGSEWDSAVVGCLGSVVRYVCMPNHDTRLGGFKGKQLLRQALACLKELVGAVPVDLWSQAWHQVGLLTCRVCSSKVATDEVYHAKASNLTSKPFKTRNG